MLLIHFEALNNWTHDLPINREWSAMFLKFLKALKLWFVKSLLISNNFIAALTLSLTSVDNDVRCRHSFFLPPYCEDNFLDPPLSNIQPNYWKKTKYNSLFLQLKFIYSEKATTFCEISNSYLTGSKYTRQIIGRDFAKFCGLC